MWVRNSTGENIASQRQRYSDAPVKMKGGHQESPALGKNLLQKPTPVYKARTPGTAPVSDNQHTSINKECGI